MIDRAAGLGPGSLLGAPDACTYLGTGAFAMGRTPHGHGLGYRVRFATRTGDLLMAGTDYAFWLTVSGAICSVACFWWMHRISTMQNTLLDQLCEQGKRIEKMSRIEHDIS